MIANSFLIVMIALSLLSHDSINNGISYMYILPMLHSIDTAAWQKIFKRKTFSKHDLKNVFENPVLAN